MGRGCLPLLYVPVQAQSQELGAGEQGSGERVGVGCLTQRSTGY